MILENYLHEEKKKQFYKVDFSFKQLYTTIFKKKIIKQTYSQIKHIWIHSIDVYRFYFLFLLHSHGNGKKSHTLAQM